MTKEEFLKAFLPEYEELFNGVLDDCIKKKTFANLEKQELMKRINNSMFNLYFDLALDHCLRRQREICAETYWSEMGDELMKWRVYEKIKQAQKPQNYGL
ncbi:MAG: hypothetical protein LBK94_05360 [Prevotellaceae bacterium]|jgi:hypothetical protein|nr:hypothetical protein [Prevotellaceae bacterium]